MEFDYFYNRDGEHFSYYMLSKILVKVMKSSGIEYIRTRLYSSWQNAEVERSHKVDKNYSTTEEDLKVKSRCTNHLKDIVQRPIL